MSSQDLCRNGTTKSGTSNCVDILGIRLFLVPRGVRRCVQRDGFTQKKVVERRYVCMDM